MNTFSIWLGGRARSSISKHCETTWPEDHEIYSIARLSSVVPWIRDVPYYRDALAANHWAGASDVARLAVLYELGGAYFDVDIEIVDRPRLWALNDGAFHIGAEDKYNEHLCGALMIAPPLHPFVRQMVDVYRNTKFTDTFNGKVNGTTLLSRNAREALGTVVIHPCSDFYPWHWGEDLTDNQKGERIELTRPITAHHWEKSWSQVNA